MRRKKKKKGKKERKKKRKWVGFEARLQPYSCQSLVPNSTTELCLQVQNRDMVNQQLEPMSASISPKPGIS